MSNYFLGRFILKILLAIIGIALYILHDGTFIKAISYYAIFLLIAFFANAGYHRWISHGAIKPTLFGKFVFYFSMVASCLLKPIIWTVVHRTHHKYSDTDKDPHTPALGFWRPLFGNYNNIPNISVPIIDLYRNKTLVFIDKYYFYLYFLSLSIFALIDIDLFLLSFAGLVLSFHIRTHIGNYMSHGGSRLTGPINTFMPFAFGEGMHKNHHDDTSRANFGRASIINFDHGYYILRGLFLIKGEKNG
jgi:stearoyl-CoA desaturase (delta-9 desaturase)